MRKLKKAPEKPPLSFLDKSIYVFWVILSFALTLMLPFFYMVDLPMMIAFSDHGVIAASNDAAIFCSIPLTMFAVFCPMLTGVYGLQKKQPIFGNRRYVYPVSRPVVRTYPIFSKDFWSKLSRGEKKRIKRVIAILAVLLAICCAVFLFGLFPRHTLDREGYCSSYNIFNVNTHNADIDDAERFTVNIDRRTHRGWRVSYHVEIKFSFEGAEYSFDLSEFDFREMTTEKALEYALSLKRALGDRCEITHADRINDLINDRNYGEKEIRLVRELFE